MVMMDQEVSIMKLPAKPEGREGIYLVDKRSIIAYISTLASEHFSGIEDTGQVAVTSNWGRNLIIRFVEDCDKIAVLLNAPRDHNMGCSLSVINGNILRCFDIPMSYDNLEII